MESVERAYETILVAAEGRLRDGTRDTPARCARALDELTAGYHVDIPGLFTVFDAEGYDEMVVERGIPFASLCEHHLLPFTGVAHVAYIPAGKIVGLSKLARLVDAYARRFQVQERLTGQVADAIVEHLDASGVMVITDARHSCMELRGCKVHGAAARMSAVRGTIKADAAARAEALALIGVA